MMLLYFYGSDSHGNYSNASHYCFKPNYSVVPAATATLKPVLWNGASTATQAMIADVVQAMIADNCSLH